MKPKIHAWYGFIGLLAIMAIGATLLLFSPIAGLNYWLTGEWIPDPIIIILLSPFAVFMIGFFIIFFTVKYMRDKMEAA